MALIGATWWLLYFSEAADAVAKETNDTPALEKKIKEAKAQLAESKKKANEVDGLREIETRLAKKLPKKNAVSELLDTIHGHAVHYGLKIRNVDIQEPVEGELHRTACPNAVGGYLQTGHRLLRPTGRPRSNCQRRGYHHVGPRRSP